VRRDDIRRVPRAFTVCLGGSILNIWVEASALFGFILLVPCMGSPTGLQASDHHWHRSHRNSDVWASICDRVYRRY
jgi:hypothetical protein